MKFPLTIELEGEEYIVTKADYKEFLESMYKDDFNTFNEEMKDEWRDEKQEEEFVPPFSEWFESVFDYKLDFNSWLANEHTVEELMDELKIYVEECQDDWED